MPSRDYNAQSGRAVYPGRLKRSLPASLTVRQWETGSATGYIRKRTIHFMSLKQQIISDLTASMKAQDSARTSTLRMVKAGIMNREIEKGSELDDDELAKLLRSMVKQRKDSVEQFEKAERLELVAKEKAEIDVIEAYLPQAASQDEIEQAVGVAIAETGAASMKDIGKVMKAVQAALVGKNADGRTVSEVVKAKLSVL